MPDVVELELVCAGGVEDGRPEQLPGRAYRHAAQHPAVIVQALHAHHLEILGVVRRRHAGVGLVEGIGEADAFDWLLRDGRTNLCG
jgi:hypothetical protein